MGNLFSGHSPHYRPPFDSRRRSRRRKRVLTSLNTASAGAVTMATQVATVAATATICTREQRLSTTDSMHLPVSHTGSSASDRSSSQPGSSTLNVAASSTNSSSLTAGVPTKQRKASLKVTLKKVYSNASATSPNVFTDERRQLVFASWQEITEKLGKFETAKLVFHNLFRESPMIRAMFGFPDGNVVEFDLESCASVNRHVHVFGNVLDLAVRNVLELEAEVGPLLVMFGRRHFYKHQVDFRNEYLIQFGQSIAEVVYVHMSDELANNPESSIAWRLFISYLIKKIKEGYDLEALQTRK